MVYLAFNCNLNARRGRPLFSQWDQTASGQARFPNPGRLHRGAALPNWATPALFI